MSGFGTDVVALTCILCGAAVGGIATFTLMDVQDEVDLRCAVATVEASPRVVVSLGDEKGAIIVRPRVRVHTSHDCASVRIHEAEVLLHERFEIEQVVISQAIELEEQIHLSMEMVEEEVQRAQLQLEKLELGQLEGMEREIEREIELLQKRLEKAGREI